MTEASRGPFRRAVVAIVDAAGRRPVAVLAAALAVLGFTWWVGSHLEPRSDFFELLPRDSPGFIAFERQLGRGATSASLLVIVESNSTADNRRFIDALADRLETLAQERARCVATCQQDCARCPPDLIATVERGTREVHAFFSRNQLLYASLDELKDAEQKLSALKASQNPLVVSLDDDPADKRDPATDLHAITARIDKVRSRLDDFPAGYFELKDGSAAGLRIVARSSGMGDRAGDQLLALVEREVATLKQGFPPGLRVGLAGDIPNAIAEKKSLVSDALWATSVAMVLVLFGIIVFYRSVWSLAIIGLPALLGVGCAYSFAMVRYGYVNTAGAFLGAIILGNGINYPIVLFSRYQEFVARGLSPEEARREAVLNSFRAELVGACVGAIAYGSLTITRFRGFSQFGAIGFFGMLASFLSMIAVVPAMLSLRDRLQPRLPRFLRDGPPRFGPEGDRGPLVRGLARLTSRYPKTIALAGLAVTVIAASRLPRYLRDPWEYDFDKLGSRGSKVGGAGDWSNKAEAVFGGKGNIAGAQMLADTPEQAEELRAAILANDRRDPKGPLLADVVTIGSLLPGTPAEQEAKLREIERIRAQVTPAMLARLSPAQRREAEALLPPADLRVLHPQDLPDLYRRRFQERNGTLGTVFYVKPRDDISLSDGHILLRLDRTSGRVRLADGTEVLTAGRASVFAEIIRSLERDGPLASFVSFASVSLVVIAATRNLRGSVLVLLSLLLGVTWTIGGGAWGGLKLNFLNFIALPITFGIGCEYPFNVYDRSRLLGGDVVGALMRVAGAVALCSYTTVIGYSSLLVADLQALQSFGRLAATGEIACLSAALLVLPALLHLWPARAAVKKG